MKRSYVLFYIPVKSEMKVFLRFPEDFNITAFDFSSTFVTATLVAFIGKTNKTAKVQHCVTSFKHVSIKVNQT